MIGPGVECNQPIVLLVDQGKQSMVIEPHDTNRHEARQKGEIRRPEVQQRISKYTLSSLRRNTDLENQQRNRDGEHAVAEGFDTSRFIGRVIPFAHPLPAEVKA